MAPKQPKRVDHNSREWYNRRLFERTVVNGYFIIPEYQAFLAIFDENILQFTANVAFALAHRLRYWSDEGRTARALVRFSRANAKYGGTLDGLHNAMKLRYKGGDLVQLAAKINRVKDPRRSRDEEALTSREEALQIFLGLNESDVKPPEKPKKVDIKADCLLVLDAVEQMGKYWQKKPDPMAYRGHGNRIVKLAEMAKQVGCVDCLTEFWYYRPHIVKIYLDGHPAKDVGDKYRREMTGGLGFPLPLDTTYHGYTWQVLPLWELSEYCAGGDLDSCVDHRNYLWLLGMDEQIRHVSNIVGYAAAKFGAGGGSTWSPLMEDFVEHFKKLQKDPKHVYSFYAEPVDIGAALGIWAKY